MPGIVGVLTRKPRKQVEIELLRMVAALKHENFYVTGTWCDESLGVYLGWVARKDSFCDGMPITNERQDVVLVFSGEEFPEAGTANRLKESGHSFESCGPSYLVHLYEEEPNFPAGLNGWFQGLVADRRHGSVTLFNDRYGMHRIYYHNAKDTFYFAAEAKAILAVRPELRRIDPQGLGEFISCGCVLGDRTLFEGIQILPNASSWIFRNGSPERKRTYFYSKEWEGQRPLPYEAYYHELREVFVRNTPRYFSGKEKIGMSLTGGLDSRMVMALQKPSRGFLPCYTFGGAFRDCRDVVVARKVAQACGQSHEVIPVGGDFLARFGRYAERTVYLTDGCVEVCHSPDLYAHERLREIAPVRMTGNYGGEVLRRVQAFKPVEPLPGLFRSEILSHVRQAVHTYTRLKQAHPLSFIAFHQIPRGYYGLFALEQSQVALRSPYLDNDIVRTVFRSPESAFENNDVCLRLIADGSPALLEIPTDRGFAGAGGHLAATLSQSLLEFLFKAEYAYDLGMPQWLAKIDHVLAPFHLERLFLGRHKFSYFRVWYRDTLSRYVQEMLLDPKTYSRSYIEPSKVETVVQGHIKRGRNYTAEIHKLLTLELVQRQFIDTSC